MLFVWQIDIDQYAVVLAVFPEIPKQNVNNTSAQKIMTVHQTNRVQMKESVKTYVPTLAVLTPYAAQRTEFHNVHVHPTTLAILK